MYGYNTRTGGTDYSTMHMDGPGGPLLRGVGGRPGMQGITRYLFTFEGAVA